MKAFAVKVKSGSAEIYDAHTRSYLGSVGSDVVSASVSGDTVQVTKSNGSVEIYNAETRSYLGSL